MVKISWKGSCISVGSNFQQFNLLWPSNPPGTDSGRKQPGLRTERVWLEPMMSPNSLAILLLALLAATAVQGRSLLQEEVQAAQEGEAAQIGGLVADLGCVRINEVVHKPAKVADVKGVDFVELHNNCNEAVNLAGWSLADEKENTFTMGQDSCGHIIEPQSKLVLFRGNGCSFDFGYSGSDVATLRDATTDIVDKVAWGKDNANKGFSWSRIPDAVGGFQDGIPTAGGENVSA